MVSLGALLSSVLLAIPLSDLDLEVTVDGECFLLKFENDIRYAEYEEVHYLETPDGAPVAVYVSHARPTGPETIRVDSPTYIVYPEEIVVPDGKEGKVWLCPPVGA